jgi:hypothetical protein
MYVHMYVCTSIYASTYVRTNGRMYYLYKWTEP